jgi:L-ribulose-5-phosphate 3-epimerase
MRYQAHPVGYWHEEFPIASELGLDCIEFILDYNDYKENPLMTINGRKKIKSLSLKTGIRVISVCADYFMEKPLHSRNKLTARKSSKVLTELLKIASELGIMDIVIPCVDKSSIKTERSRDRFMEVFHQVIPEAEKCKVNLSLETDLNPFQFEKLLSSLNSYRVTVNYDIGNSASLGYNYIDELKAYGEKITDIHIKDRKINGPSVKLGEGNANIPEFFCELSKYNYSGPLIMQAYRDNDGLKIFKEQFEWITPFLPNIIKDKFYGN